jgi:RHS repeat-associated protein
LAKGAVGPENHQRNCRVVPLRLSESDSGAGGAGGIAGLAGQNVPTANLLTGLGIDEYITQMDSLGTAMLLTDALGSTIALTNPAGGIQTNYTYEPFGKVSLSGTSNANPYQFTGRENDGTGLYFYRARYYSPTFQRFIAQDPLQFAGRQINLYACMPALQMIPYG